MIFRQKCQILLFDFWEKVIGITVRQFDKVPIASKVVNDRNRYRNRNLDETLVESETHMYFKLKSIALKFCSKVFSEIKERFTP